MDVATNCPVACDLFVDDHLNRIPFSCVYQRDHRFGVNRLCLQRVYMCLSANECVCVCVFFFYLCISVHGFHFQSIKKKVNEWSSTTCRMWENHNLHDVFLCAFFLFPFSIFVRLLHLMPIRWIMSWVYFMVFLTFLHIHHFAFALVWEHFAWLAIFFLKTVKTAVQCSCTHRNSHFLTRSNIHFIKWKMNATTKWNSILFPSSEKRIWRQ